MKKKILYCDIMLFISIVSTLIFSSCGEKEDDNTLILVPTIGSISPESGKPGDIITIKGNYFGKDKSKIKVKFDKADATNIVSVEDTKIEVGVPAGLLKPSVDITVHVANSSSNKKPFSYINPKAPLIDSVFPGLGKQGDTITIIGNYFGSDKTKVKVRFNLTDATNIVSVENTKIDVEVPEGIVAASVEISVEVANFVSNKYFFTYLKPPSLATITSSCFYGSSVEIIGVNFSQEVDGNKVMFGEIEATVTEASKTKIKVIAPDLGSATSADVTVTVHDMVSNVLKINVDFDQNKVATYNWALHTVRPGLIYKTGQFTLFGSTTRRIHVLDVTLGTHNILGIGFTTNNKPTVDLCIDYDAVAGINAGYFPMAGATDKDPYIRINGATVQVGHEKVSTHFTNAALLINNNLATIRKFTENATNLNEKAAAIPVSQASNVIVCGPMLLSNGQIENLDMSKTHNYSSTARTGLGVTADGKRVFLVVVDYNQGATGVQTPQLAKILQALGAVSAMNLDGGGSSTMFVRDQGDNGRVSINTYQQRAVRSVIYVK